MTDLTKIIVATVWEGQQPWILARVVGQDGAYINQASVSLIEFTIRDKTDTEHETAGGDLDKTKIVSDSLITDDPRWPPNFDSTGYNAKHRVPPGSLPIGGHHYLYYMRIYDTSSPPDFVIVAADIEAKDLPF